MSSFIRKSKSLFQESAHRSGLNLTSTQMHNLKVLLRQNPRVGEIKAFLTSCHLGETNPTSTARKIQNSQLRAALSLMDSNTLNNWSGTH